MSAYDTRHEQRETSAGVAVVGAGPTGVMLAIELARRGIEVRVLDKRHSRSPESRAIGIHARTLEVFHQLGVVDEFLQLGHRVDGMVFHTRARRQAQARFSRLDSPYPFLLTLSQEQTQRILDRRLESLGVTIDRGVEVLDLDQDADGVKLRVRRSGEQREQVLTVGWVVGCDGAHSIVRRRLGLSFDGEEYGQDWLIAEGDIDVPLRGDRFHIFAYTDAPVPMFPLPGGRWRVFLPQVPNRAGVRQAPDMQEIEQLLAERGPSALKLSNPSLLAAFRCYRRSTPVMRGGRVLVAGDAAHIHTPAGGQGLNTGLSDAFNLGWKLALVARRQSPPALLDTYQDERVPIAGGVLALTHALVRTFTLASPRKRWLRDHALPTLLAMPGAERHYTTRLAQLSHHYRGGPLAPGATRSRHQAFAPGDRLPVVCGLRVGDKRVSTLDLLASPAHRLLILPGRDANGATASDAIERFARWAPIVEPIVINGSSAQSRGVVDPDLRAHRRYRASRGRLLLVRPDGHLAASAPPHKPEPLERYLRQLQGDDCAP